MKFQEELDQAIKAVEDASGKIFDGKENPLFFTLECGVEKRESSPSVEYTNIGFSKDRINAYAEYCGSLHEAYKLYIEHLACLIGWFFDGDRDVEVKDILNDSELMKDYFKAYYSGKNPLLDDYISLPDLEGLVRDTEDKFKEITGRDVPDAREQLDMAIKGVIKAYAENALRNINKESILVQECASGKIFDGRSFSGVFYSRDLNTGEEILFGDVRFSSNEYISTARRERYFWHYKMRWRRDAGSLEFLKEKVPDLYPKIKALMERIENEHIKIQDVTIISEKGKLFVKDMFANEECMSDMGKVIRAFDNLKRGLDEEDLAFEEIEEHELMQCINYLEAPDIKEAYKARAFGRGAPVMPGVVTDRIKITKRLLTDFKGIVVSEASGAQGKALYDHRKYCKSAGSATGYICEGGGDDDHLAFAMKESLNIKPRICQVEGMKSEDNYTKTVTINGRKLRNGDVVTICGKSGLIFKGELTPLAFEDSEVVRVENGDLDPARVLLVSVLFKGKGVA